MSLGVGEGSRHTAGPSAPVGMTRRGQLFARAAKRFAQDDGFVGGYAENTKGSKKSLALEMAKGEGRCPLELGRDQAHRRSLRSASLRSG
jgi:hypothetical protein